MAHSVPIMSAICLQIKPYGRVCPVRLTFDIGIGHPFTEPTQKPNFETVCRNMSIKYDCPLVKNRVAKALHPNETFYTVFYQNSKTLDHSQNSKILDQGTDLDPNDIASHLVNSFYDTDGVGSTIKCYGDCYIVHIDDFYQVHDVGVEAFSVMYNKIHTPKGVEERSFANRLTCWKSSEEQIYYQCGSNTRRKSSGSREDREKCAIA